MTDESFNFIPRVNTGLSLDAPLPPRIGSPTDPVNAPLTGQPEEQASKFRDFVLRTGGGQRPSLLNALSAAFGQGTEEIRARKVAARQQEIEDVAFERQRADFLANRRQGEPVRDAAGFLRHSGSLERLFPGVEAPVKTTAQSGIGKLMADFNLGIINQDMLNSEFARLTKNDPAKVFAPQRILNENNEIRLQIPRIDSQGNVELIDIGAAPKLTAQQESALEIDQAREEALIKTQQALDQSRGLKKEAREDKFISTAFAAAGEIQDINRANELIELVNTGGFEAAKASFTDFFGTTPGDVGELRRILAQNVLNGLAVFTGAISEGEREFLSSITTSISQGNSVNKRNLARLSRIANNAVKTGRAILERRGDTETLELFDIALGEQAAPAAGVQGQGKIVIQNGVRFQQQPDGSFKPI